MKVTFENTIKSHDYYYFFFCAISVLGTNIIFFFPSTKLLCTFKNCYAFLNKMQW